MRWIKIFSWRISAQTNKAATKNDLTKISIWLQKIMLYWLGQGQRDQSHTEHKYNIQTFSETSSAGTSWAKKWPASTCTDSISGPLSRKTLQICKLQSKDIKGRYGPENAHGHSFTHWFLSLQTLCFCKPHPSFIRGPANMYTYIVGGDLQKCTLQFFWRTFIISRTTHDETI